MSSQFNRQELIQLWLTAADEQAADPPMSDEQTAALNQLIEENTEARRHVIALSQQLAWLMWHGSNRADDIDLSDVDAVVARIGGLIDDDRHLQQQEQSRRARLYSFLDEFAEQAGVLIRPPLVFFTLIAAALFGGYVAYRFSGSPLQTQADPAPIAQDLPKTAPYAATFVNVTNCRWDESRSTANIRGGSRLEPGQSLCLLEGIAEINSKLPRGGVGRFQLEGPAAMTLTSEGVPSLQYGRMAAQITSDFDQFSLETPMGRVTVHYDSSIGVVSSANEVELHVFAGLVTFEPAWPAAGYPSEQWKVAADNSVRISTSAKSGLEVHRAAADVKRFAPLTSMTTSQLNISDAYVAAVQSAKPIGYWRFESDSSGLVRNEISNRLHLTIHGAGMRWRKYGENRSAEFGANSEPCCLMSEETVDGIVSKNYSVEAWVKPSHYHHATLFGLMKRASAESYVAEHCVLIELCASPHGHMSTSSAQWDLHPGKFRYLYRSPAGFAGGESCFSRDVYALRKWQHMVACKTDDLVRLYIDGRLSDESQAPQNLTPELHILVGQLFPPAPDQTLPMRSFAGELDELALYDRELTPEEVKAHFNLAQPNTEKTTQPRRESAGPET